MSNFFIISVLLFSCIHPELLSVTILSTPGDTLPSYSMPKLTNVPFTGRITKQGLTRLAAVGDTIRSRYLLVDQSSFPEEYDSDYFTFRAAPSTSAKESTNAFVYGLFPPGTGQKYSNGSFIYANGTTVAAIHSGRANSDTLLSGYSDCPRSAYVSYYYMQDDDYQDTLKNNSGLLDDLEKATGANLKDTDSKNRTEVELKQFAMLEGLYDLHRMNDPTYPIPDSITYGTLTKAGSLYRNLFFQRYHKNGTDHCYAAVGRLFYQIFFTDYESDVSYWKSGAEDATRYSHFRFFDIERPEFSLFHDCLGFSWDEEDESLFPTAGSHFIIETHFNSTNNKDVTNPYLKVYYATNPNIFVNTTYQDITSTHTTHSSTIPLSTIQSSISELKSQLGPSASFDAFDIGYCDKQTDADVDHTTATIALVMFILLTIIFIGIAAVIAILVYFHVRNVNIK